MASQKETAEIDVKINGKQASQTVKDLEKDVRNARAEWRKAKIGTEEYIQATKKLKQSETILKKHKADIKSTEDAWSRLTGGFNKYLGVITAGVGLLTGVGFGLQSQIEYIGQLDDAYADVMKTTGLTYEETKKLDEEFGKFNTRTARLELLKLAEEAGKLGISGTKEVSKFVKEANQIKVALGKDLGEDAIVQMGKLSNIFGDTMTELASGINSIGAASEASEPYQVDFLTRTAGIAKTARITSGDLMGYGATLESLGQSAEVSSTAMNTVMVDFLKNAEGFGEVAGFARGELTKLLNEKGTNTAFIAFLEKLQQGAGDTENMMLKLEALGINGSRGANVFLTLAQNIETLRKQQDVANKAVTEGTSVLDEYNIKNENVAAALEKAGHKVRAAFSEIVNQDAIAKVLNFLMDLPEWVQRNEVLITALAGAYLTYNAANIQGLLIKAKEHLLLQAGIGLKIKDAVVTQALAIKQNYLNAAQAAGVAGAGKFKAAMAGVRAAMTAALGPVGLVIMGVTGLISAIKLYDKYNATSIRLDHEKKLAQEEVARAVAVLDQTYKVLHGSVKEMNRLSVEEKNNLRESIKLNLEKAKSELLLAKAKQDDILAENSRTSLWQKAGNILSNVGNVAGVVADEMNDAVENGKEAAGEMNDEIEALNATIDAFAKDYENLNDVLNAESNADKILGDNLTALNEKVSLYQTALNNAKLGSEDYIRIQQKLAKVQEQIRKGSTPIPDKEALDKLKKDYEAFQNKVVEMAREADLAKKPIQEQEIIRATQAFDELLRQAQEFYGKGLASKKQYEATVVSITEARQQKIDEINHQQYEKEAELRKKELEEKEEKRKEEYEAYAELREEIYQLSLSGKELEMYLVEKEFNEKIAKAKEMNLQWQVLEEEKREKLAEINEKYDEEEDEKRRERQQRQLELLELGMDTVSTILENKRNQASDKALSEIEKQKEAELAALEDSNASKEELDKQKEAIDQKYREQVRQQKLKDFEQEKKANIASAVMKGALAALNALVIAKDPASLAALLIAAGASTIANIAVIASQQPPEFAQGGFTEKSVSNLKPAGIVHANEYVVPHRVLSTPQGFSMVQALESMRVGRSNGFADGGFTSPAPGPASGAPVPGIGMDAAAVKEFAAAVNIFSQAARTPFRAFIVPDNVLADQIQQLIDENSAASNSTSV